MFNLDFGNQIVTTNCDTRNEYGFSEIGYNAKVIDGTPTSPAVVNINVTFPFICYSYPLLLFGLLGSLDLLHKDPLTQLGNALCSWNGSPIPGASSICNSLSINQYRLENYNDNGYPLIPRNVGVAGDIPSLDNSPSVSKFLTNPNAKSPSLTFASTFTAYDIDNLVSHGACQLMVNGTTKTVNCNYNVLQLRPKALNEPALGWSVVQNILLLQFTFYSGGNQTMNIDLFNVLQPTKIQDDSLIYGVKGGVVWNDATTYFQGCIASAAPFPLYLSDFQQYQIASYREADFTLKGMFPLHGNYYGNIYVTCPLQKCENQVCKNLNRTFQTTILVQEGNTNIFMASGSSISCNAFVSRSNDESVLFDPSNILQTPAQFGEYIGISCTISAPQYPSAASFSYLKITSFLNSAGRQYTYCDSNCDSSFQPINLKQYPYSTKNPLPVLRFSFAVDTFVVTSPTQALKGIRIDLKSTLTFPTPKTNVQSSIKEFFRYVWNTIAADADSTTVEVGDMMFMSPSADASNPNVTAAPLSEQDYLAGSPYDIYTPSPAPSYSKIIIACTVSAFVAFSVVAFICYQRKKQQVSEYLKKLIEKAPSTANRESNKKYQTMI